MIIVFVRLNMNQHTTINRIGAMLATTVVITILYSYIPLELTPVRQLLSLVQLGFMIAIMTLTMRIVLRDF